MGDSSEESFDDEQLDLLEITNDKPMIVSGCAGSGKSLIAMYKARQLFSEGKDVILIAYTKSLKAFMMGGLNFSDLKIYTYQEWLSRGAFCADYIIVDEIQDFIQEDVLSFIKSARISYFFFGDDAQSIYKNFKNTISIEDIAELTGIEPLKLYNNYRLPRGIAKITQDYLGLETVMPYKEKIYQSKIESLPYIVHLDSNEEQAAVVLKIIKDNHDKSIGILLPNNDAVSAMEIILNQQNLKYEIKLNEKNDNDKDEVKFLNSKCTLNFSNYLPKLMTYHSAKGLQFDIVILPMYSGTEEKNREPLYVAMTRTREKLYILYVTAELMPPLDSVPKHLYLKKI